MSFAAVLAGKFLIMFYVIVQIFCFVFFKVRVSRRWCHLTTYFT